MSDGDLKGGAWRVAPSQYAAGREVPFALPARPLSRYLAMRDGCRIAVDTWLPEGATGPVPAVLILTPYYRRFALAPGSEADAIPNAGKFIRYLVPRGYAVVVVDVRGTGASSTLRLPKTVLPSSSASTPSETITSTSPKTERRCSSTSATSVRSPRRSMRTSPNTAEIRRGGSCAPARRTSSGRGTCSC